MIRGDALAALAPVAETLETLGIRYHLGGSIASSAHGIPRSTVDVDMVADLRATDIDALVRALADAYYIERDAVAAAVSTRSSFKVVHLETMTKVDVFIPTQDAFARSELERARPESVTEDGRHFVVQSPEDVMLRKLQWYRLGREVSGRQWNDVVGVLRIQAGKLDLAYLRRWAARLEVGDLLDRAVLEAAQPPPATDHPSNR